MRHQPSAVLVLRERANVSRGNFKFYNLIRLGTEEHVSVSNEGRQSSLHTRKMT